ncbi:50S ribosomal protein L1 [Juglans microcarpa x Juglans regia]|uniref:50S ribosomal protein L1 n=1 Tax=Juglans microcarpa x Juglans regia TaxID=2249226 RepID=UPI001B7E31AE|nr:50S ribosomal protein L1 [Juglans microcarpa x Juglans regia]
MAALKLLFQVRRHCLPKPPSFPPFRHRSLSSSTNSNPSPNSETPTKPSESVPVQTVSYPVKPSEPSTPDQDQHENLSQSPQLPRRNPPRNSQPETPSIWTREDIRYVKDVPSISPVSYPSRVAPLPEDRVSGEGEKAPEAKGESEEMEREGKRIEEDVRLRRGMFRVLEEEEKVVVPFPMLIKKKERKENLAPLDLMEAIRLVKANAKKNFDETVEAHVRLGIKKERTDQIVHGSLILPHGVAKDVRVAFFAEGADADEARAAGADIVGGVELIEEIASSHKFNVDKCFSTPQLVLRLNKIAGFLKERHLLPDRKHNTVTSDVAGAIKAARLGRILFKMDKTSIVHVGLGKASFTEEFLRENIGAFMNALLLAKPPSLKKASKYAGYVNSFHICSTMGPGFPISMQSLSKAADNYSKAHLN